MMATDPRRSWDSLQEFDETAVDAWLAKKDAQRRAVKLVSKDRYERDLRASRRCSDCVHWDAASGWKLGEQEREVTMMCARGRWADTDLVSLFRTAASCDDYEEVDDSEEGVRG
jgi:hypothetical protein